MKAFETDLGCTVEEANPEGSCGYVAPSIRRAPGPKHGRAWWKTLSAEHVT
jgi:hypothetical protein